ncbi:MAG: substrate-binding domain-containing protein [Clostridiaceae bacterium]|nr:substrate-binding domain-containing protein [Clostridiaceae bacterium]
MRKKLLAVLLAVVLSVAVVAFAACSSDDGDGRIDLIPNLTLLYETDADMINTYSLIAVNPAAPFTGGVTPNINTAGADAFIIWLTSEEGLNAVKDYGKEQYDEALFYIETDFVATTAAVPHATDATKNINLSTTTSVNDSGLLEGYLKPLFEDKYGYNLKIASNGTGAAIKAATDGNADLLLVHSKSQEETFISGGYARKVEGFAAERVHFMYNYFVLIGPKDDPAGVKDAAKVKDAFAKIAAGRNSESPYQFISRGDNSGTHTAELKLWAADLGITDTPDAAATGNWYISAGTGMGNCLIMANEKKAYVLSDKATYLTYKNFIEA